MERDPSGVRTRKRDGNRLARRRSRDLRDRGRAHTEGREAGERTGSLPAQAGTLSAASVTH
jgi:hypothetical protein